MNGSRRNFLRNTGNIAALSLLPNAEALVRRIEVVDRIGSPASAWAAHELQNTAGHHGGKPDLYVVVEAGDLPPEGFRLRQTRYSGRPAIQLTASGSPGFVYGLLELRDRLRFGGDLLEEEDARPANRVRSVSRAFVSEVEDKPWFYDREYWLEYLTMLASHRFNRFALTLGLGYDFPRDVVGDYLHFPYPYLLDVPGYSVKVVPLAPGERERNLETLRFIGEQCALRGLQFQLGLWTHAYQWTDSPRAQHRIEGLTPDTHGAYCRDALTLLLKKCPAITGITLRVHGESGIPENSHSFWQHVFDGVTSAGRAVALDLHAKGLDQEQLDMALRTGMPVSISPKYWAEHMGLGYHQASIRELEMPRPGSEVTGTFAVSEGSRRFMRYGYGDLFQTGRKYDVLFRMWPGTQRLLLWGDPAAAAAFGRASSFQGAAGIEICEPLFFKGRQGSGLPGGRCAYRDPSLTPQRDFQKYLYTYRVWGRLLYDPEAHPATWRRYLKSEFGEAAPALENAIQQGSRVLPLFTTARLPSASNQGCWPEIYTNMPIVQPGAPEPYSDTATPHRLGTVSPLDPQLFSSITEHTREILEGHRSGKYSPLEVATWLEDAARSAIGSLENARRSGTRAGAAFWRAEEDVRIQAGLGNFFAGQIRSALLFEIYTETGDPAAREAALAKYREARDAWAQMAQRASRVYRPDITFGETPVRRGHWLDRLEAIDADLRFMQASVHEARQRVPQAIQSAQERKERPAVACTHQPPKSVTPGQPLPISLQAPAGIELRLFFRHIDQAERWESVEMLEGTAQIPTTYTQSAFGIEYYFELRRSSDDAWLYPALGPDLANRPYFVVSLA